MSEEAPPFERGTDIVVLVEHKPEIVLLDKDAREKLFEHIEQEIEAFEPDLSTEKSRGEIKSLAYKITRTKTAIDKARKDLTEEWRDKIAKVNAEGKPINERLAALADQVRKPLTDWETAEEERIERCTSALNSLRESAVIPMGATADQLRTRLQWVETLNYSEELWKGMWEIAEKARDTAIEALKAAIARVEQEERDRAELARLRAEAEERERQDRERAEREEAERIARERKEREEQEAKEKAEREAAEAQKREVEREEREKMAAAAAAEAAQREAEARAAEQAEAQKRAHEAELAAERERAAQAERRAEEERRAREAEDRRRKEEEERAAAERARKEADQDRRTQAKREAKEAIMTAGVDNDTAQKVVLLIIAGEVPRVFLDFAAEPRVKREPAKEGQLV